jgi:UDP-3-O-[3-hydroxymyristoyl] N-acetylglucosamine deacetylase
MIDVVLSPRPINSGIWFERTDLNHSVPILASAENVSDTSLATTIGHGAQSLSTLEHLLAALGGLGISNLKVDINGPEAPILDGSAEPWVKLLMSAGFQTQNAARPYLRVIKPLKLTDGDKFIAVEPANNFSVDFTIDFPGFLRTQNSTFKFSKDSFVNEISPARTFCLLKDVETMKLNGKALGGGLDNSVVVGDDGILNPEGLRFPDECVRHKILDFIGDMSLAQAHILGKFTAYKTGHTLNQKFLSSLLNGASYLERVKPQMITASIVPRNYELPRPSLSPLRINSENEVLNPAFG